MKSDSSPPKMEFVSPQTYSSGGSVVHGPLGNARETGAGKGNVLRRWTNFSFF